MITYRLKGLIPHLGLALLIGLMVIHSNAYAQEAADSVKVPSNIMKALNARFPEAQIDKWTKEREEGIVVYDFEFSQDNQKFEADILEDGSIQNWEQEITLEALPETVKNTVTKQFPEAVIKMIMQITALEDGKEVLEGYELQLGTEDKKVVEITVAPEGKILEGPEAEE